MNTEAVFNKNFVDFLNFLGGIMKTLVVNLLGAAGSGKSTLATELFMLMKRKGYNCEYVDEYAKHIVYEENYKRLGNQLLVLSNQYFSLDVIRDKVNVIITDSPLILSIFYNRENSGKNHLKVPDKLIKDLVLYCYSTFDNLNYFLVRNHEYKREGRYQTEAEAKAQEGRILAMVEELGLDYKEFLSTDNCAEKILSDVENRVKFYDQLEKSEFEIERKFLMKFSPKDFESYNSINILQGYFLRNAHEVRVRNIDNKKFFLTEKYGEGIKREEFEKEIDRKEYQELIKLAGDRVIQKSRTLIPIQEGKVAEVDLYFGKNKGLATVEVEFESLDEAENFVPPDWFGTEVTNNEKFSNKNLSLVQNFPNTEDKNVS